MSANCRRLAGLRNKHIGQRAFVIGNGPSLKTADLDRLGNEITFACNKIYLAFDTTEWRPTYYAAEDILMLQHHLPGVYDFRSSIKLFPTYAIGYARRDENAIYYRQSYRDFYPNLPRFSSDPMDRVYGGNTVIYALLQFAVYMGIREVYLLGVDFHYDTPKERVSSEADDNFSMYRVGDEKNHFHQDYLRPGDLMCNPNIERHEKAYQSAKIAMEQRGGRIVNVTRGGKLEVFPRLEFETLF